MTFDFNKFSQHLHNIRQRVYYEDTDFSGAIYHANYLKYFERGRTDWLRSLGVIQSELYRRNFAFVVTNININFLAPAKMDDEINILTKVNKITPARIVFSQTISYQKNFLAKTNPDIILCSAEVSVCAVLIGTTNNANKPIRLSKVF